MKMTTPVFALVALLVLVPFAGVSAKSDRGHDYEHGSHSYHSNYNYNRNYNYNYNRNVVQTPYWCGSYWSSYSCPSYQYSYPQYYNYSNYYYPTYPYYQQPAPYYSQPGYWNGGAWIPYYNW